MDNQPTPTAPSPTATPQPLDPNTLPIDPNTAIAPEEPFNMGQNKIEFIDKLQAPTTPRKYKFWQDPTIIKFGIAAVVIIAVAFTVVGIVGSQRGRSAEVAESLSLRLTNLTTLRADFGASNKILNSQLRAISTRLGAALGTAARDIQYYLPDLGVDPKNPSASIAATEANWLEYTRSYLNDAAVNGRLDRAFATVFNSQLETVLEYYNELDTREPSPQLHEYISLSKTNLQAIKIELETFLRSNP